DGIHTANAVEHRADDDALRVRPQRDAASRIERVDGTNQTDAPVTDQIADVAARDHPRDPFCDEAQHRKKLADLRLTIAHRRPSMRSERTDRARPLRRRDLP